MKNWVDLMRPCSKVMRGVPFVVKKAISVDLFPHTPHVELVLLFERDPEKDESEEVVVEAEVKPDADAEMKTVVAADTESKTTVVGEVKVCAIVDYSCAIYVIM